MISIRQGLDLPITGEPEQIIHDGPAPRTVAVLGPDYVGMKPTMAVSVGDRVAAGQMLFSDKKTPGVQYTAPAGGTVSAINRGHKRMLLSVVIDIEGDDARSFENYSAEAIKTLSREQVEHNLVDSGLWTALRTRPFSRVPALGTIPHSIFVTAIDTHPLAGDPQIVIAERSEDFVAGLRALGRLTEGKVFVATAPGAQIAVDDESQVSIEEFSGPHPAGLAGTHIHFLDPVSESRTAWSIGYQDVIAIGALFVTGKLDSRRVVSLAGSAVNKPRLLRTLMGVNLEELTAGELASGENRVVSGSLLGGREAVGAMSYLGRYHVQVCVVPEGRERRFLGWFSPGVNRHSVTGVYLSSFFSKRKMAMDTSTNGSPRAMVPIGSYEKVVPLDVLPTPLLKSLVVGDVEMAIKLGALELDEEDLALCTYVCPGKYEYGPILRDNLDRIFSEG